MESGRGGRKCRHSHSTGLLSPSWRRSTDCLQGVLMFIMFTVQFQWGFSKRNEFLDAGTANGAWNKTRYKTEDHCSRFHGNTTPSDFYYWPEDDPTFDHCCGRSDMFEKFAYGKYGPQLLYVAYYDLGLIDQCLPYWRCLHLFKRMFETITFHTYCEVNDVRKLYKRRFFIDTLFKRSLWQSAIPLILFSEILVILSIGLYTLLRRRRPRLNESRHITTGATKSWIRNMRKTFARDWTHLCLLAIVGNGLIDATGRQDPYLPQSKAFYNYGRLYVILSILVACSSVLHQIASWIAEMDDAADSSKSTAKASSVTSGDATSLSHQSRLAVLEKDIGLNDDWKWQPIAAQLGILFCLFGFLTYPTSDKDSSGAVIGIVVSAACPWSGLYASKVIVQTVLWLIRRVYQKYFSRRRNYRGSGAPCCICNSGQAVVVEHDTALLDRRTRPHFWSLWIMITPFRASSFIWKVAQIHPHNFVADRFLFLQTMQLFCQKSVFHASDAETLVCTVLYGTVGPFGSVVLE